MPVLAFGLWLCVLTRSRGPVARWPRYAADLLVIGVVAAGLIVVHRTDRLVAARLLFPLGVAPAYRLWRKMGRSSRPAVRAGADVALSVLLGTELLLLFVWAADVAHLSPGGVTLLRRSWRRRGRPPGSRGGHGSRCTRCWPPPVWGALPHESPIDASVDLANQARYLQERTGPCAGCPHPRRPGEEPHEFRPEHPIERP